MRRQHSAAAFTLVEILTVVGIIALLIAILVPSLSAARDSARFASSQAAIAALETGIEAFRLNETVGDGYYPPSASDRVNPGRQDLTYRVASPYQNIDADIPNNFQMTGAGLLVWAMVGADQLGSAGFKTYRNTADNPTQEWSRDTDNIYNQSTPTRNGAYALDGARQPARPRAAPFVDTSRVRVTPWSAEARGFEVERETETRDSLGQSRQKRNYPMFVDAFGSPVLYWRADPTGIVPVDLSPDDVDFRPGAGGAAPSGIAAPPGTYHFADNGPLLKASGHGQPSGSSDGADPMLQLSASESDHLLIKRSRRSPGTVDEVNADNFPFESYILDTNIRARPQAQKADSFILVSAGKDGIYGTDDDVTNFNHTGLTKRNR